MAAEILYPVSEVAEKWRCSRDHIYDLISSGALRTVPLGTGKRAKTRIPESALAEYVERKSERVTRARTSSTPSRRAAA